MISNNTDSTLLEIEKRLDWITKNHWDKDLIKRLNFYYDFILKKLDNFNKIVNFHRKEISDKVYDNLMKHVAICK